MINIDRKRGAVLVSSACLVASLMATPASAQGFFDQLFGGGSSPQPYYNAPSTDLPPGFDDDAPRHHKKKRAVSADSDGKPQLQKPTDLMSDKTLRVGDAVMMKDGLHIYKGGYGAKHSADQFVALDRSRQISSTEREKLAALDVTQSSGVIEHRSSTDVVPGFKITDARGNSIRYVGP